MIEEINHGQEYSAPMATVWTIKVRKSFLQNSPNMISDTEVDDDEFSL